MVSGWAFAALALSWCLACASSVVWRRRAAAVSRALVLEQLERHRWWRAYVATEEGSRWLENHRRQPDVYK